MTDLQYCGHTVLSGRELIRCETDTHLRCQGNPSAHQHERAVGGAPGQTDEEHNGPSGPDVGTTVKIE